MANYAEVFDSTQKIFDEIIKKADLERVMSVKILTNNRAKEIGKVVKANDLLNYLAKEDVIIVINEEIFEKLDADQKIMVADDLVTAISFNFENDSITITKPDIHCHSGILKKYGMDNVIKTQELIKLIFSQREDKEKEKKANEKADKIGKE